jgi:AcrR family transcriptional regulator
MRSAKVDAIGTTRRSSAAGLPTLLERALHLQPSGLGKKERTRRQLLQAALRVFAVRGVGTSTVQEIAENAGMTTGTVYNHFDTKEAVVQAVAAWLADTLCGAISESQADVREGAQRMAIGQRRCIELAEQSPAWALVILDVAGAAPEHLAAEIARYAGADLRLGILQGDFKVSDEAAAMDLIMGVPWQAMRSVAMGMTSPGHDTRVTAMLLQGLGMTPAKAARVAAQPLPPLRDEDRHRGMSLARGLVSSGARSKKLAASPRTAAHLRQAPLQRAQSQSAHRGDKGKPTSGD